MIVSFRITWVTVAAFILTGTGSHAEAAFGPSKDWPCVQREVPEISAGMVWTGDPLDTEDKSWTKNAAVANVVQKLTSRRNSVEEAIKTVNEFAAGLKENRKESLRAVFTGTLQRINAERRQIMGGIKRYARRQNALADQIKNKSLEEAKLARKSDKTEEEKQRLAQLTEEITWDTRIYEEREQSLRYVCETPVFMEQRLFQLGRHISQLIRK